MEQTANAADFGDLLLWPTNAMQVSTDYRARWAGRFDSILADEYQDVNRAQFLWLRLLAVQGEIFVVGDDDQSIFGFRGADVSYIRRFAQDFPAAKRFKLEENFRSDGHILDAANAVIGDLERMAGVGRDHAARFAFWRDYAHLPGAALLDAGVAELKRRIRSESPA